MNRSLLFRLSTYGVLAALGVSASACKSPPSGDDGGTACSTSMGASCSEPSGTGGAGVGGANSGGAAAGGRSSGDGGGSGGKSATGGSSDPGGSGGVDNGAGGGVDNGSGGADNGGGAGPLDECDTSTDGAACNDEGAVCGGGCTDECSFCSWLRCADGAWQRVEAAPAPCVECGDSLRCNILDTYCLIQGETTASCEPFPTACESGADCDCLEERLIGVSCRGTPENGLIVESSGPVAENLCSCTVIRSGSSWCPSGGGVDEEYSVEWVGHGDTAPVTELNAECVELPTGAVRWCCREDFSPTCVDP